MEKKTGPEDSQGNEGLEPCLFLQSSRSKIIFFLLRDLCLFAFIITLLWAFFGSHKMLTRAEKDLIGLSQFLLSITFTVQFARFFPRLPSYILLLFGDQLHLAVDHERVWGRQILDWIPNTLKIPMDFSILWKNIESISHHVSRVPLLWRRGCLTLKLKDGSEVSFSDSMSLESTESASDGLVQACLESNHRVDLINMN